MLGFLLGRRRDWSDLVRPRWDGRHFSAAKNRQKSLNSVTVHLFKSNSVLPKQQVTRRRTPRFSAAGMVRMKNHEIGLGPLDLKSRPTPHCWVRRNSRESTNFHFGPVEGGFPGQRTATKAPSLHTNGN